MTDQRKPILISEDPVVPWNEVPGGVLDHQNYGATNNTSTSKPEEQVFDGKIFGNNEILVEDDIYSFSSGHVKTSYHEVISETKDTQMLEIVQTVYSKAYFIIQSLVYNVLAITIGSVFVLFYAILLGMANFVNVFIIQPSFKFFFIFMRNFAIMTRACVRSFMDPFMNSFALTLSRIAGRLKLNIPGVRAIGNPTIHA